jgi:hypothetical protein
MLLPVTEDKVNEVRRVVDSLVPYAMLIFEGFKNDERGAITDAIVDCFLEINRQGLMD